MSGKRQRSSSPSGSSLRRGEPRSRVEEPRRTLRHLTSHQEIFLRILGFLSPNDLVQVQGVNRYWASMSLDPQLWKRLYLSRYPHPHYSKLIFRDAPSPSPSRGQRPIARLPSRAFPPPSPRRSPSLRGGDSPARSETSQKAEGKGYAVPLPSRVVEPAAGASDEIGSGVRNDGVDWKMMLRLGTNWANGNVANQSTISLPPSPSPSVNGQEPIAGPSRSPRPPPYSEQHIALFPSFIITSNPSSPLVHVHPSSGSPSAVPLGIIPPPPGWSSPHRPDNVTAICADQSVSAAEDEDGTIKPALPARLAIFYGSGGFVVVRVRQSPGSSRISWSRESIHPPLTRPKSLKRRATSYTLLEGDPVVLAAMHFPVLLTCTLAFHLSVYTLSESPSSTPDRPKHLSTMHSDVSFHPAALSLLPTDTDSTPPILPANTGIANSFRAGLTYCTPLYPASWTVAVQEFGIDLDTLPGDLGLGGDVWRGECYNVGPSHADLEEDVFEWPKRVKPVIGVKGSRAVGIGTDGRWCVLAGGDNQIQVYSLPTPSPSPPPSRDSRKQEDDTSPITHFQTLLAHYGDVTSLSLSSGRCVSGGKDGRVLVWDLDEVEDERPCRTVGYVEVRPGGRRNVWRGAAGPLLELRDDEGTTGSEDEDDWDLPHPQSISSAARSLFLARPPTAKDALDEDRPAIRHLAFDEEKIVGLVNEGGSAGDVMKVWSFNG